MKTLLKNGIVITMDNRRTKKYEPLDILIENDTISIVKENINEKADKIIDCENKVIMPGLINAHTHLGMSIFRATNDDLTLQDWLENKIWPIEDNMTEEDIYYSTLLSCVEMIKTGSTCANDMYFGWQGIMKAVLQSKIRISMSRCLMGNCDKESEERIKDFENLVKKYKNYPLATFTVAPHAMYTCTKEYLKKCSLLAKKYNFPVHMHFCENESEVENITKDYNASPVNALKEASLLDNKLIIAHGTFITESDQKILKNYDVSIATNPVSNLNLGCGIADLTSYKKNNINICLGTDGQGSGNNLNMFKHMSLVADLQKALYKDSTVMNSYEVLKMATINGAKALGLEDKIGSIEEGKKADIVILDLNKITTYPFPDLIVEVTHNIESNNIYGTIINGEVLYLDNKLYIDVEEKNLIKKINEITARLNLKNE